MSNEQEVRTTTSGEGEEKKEEDGCAGGIINTIGGFVKGMGSALGSAFHFGKPDADFKGIHVKHFSLNDAQIIVDVQISNPNPVPIPLVDIDYSIHANDNKLVSGVIPDAGTIHAHGAEIIKIPVNINFKELTETFDDINPGQILKYLIKVILIIDVPVFGRFEIPLDTDGDIPIPQKPDVDLEKVKIHHLGWSETRATLHLKVENFNPFDMGINKLYFDLKFGDDSVGQATYDEKNAVIQKGSDGAGPAGIGRLQVPFMLSPKEIGGAAWDMVRGKNTGYTLTGHAEVDTPWGPIDLPFKKEGTQTKVKKDEDGDSDDDK